MSLKVLSLILFAGVIMARVIHSRKRLPIAHDYDSSEEIKANRRQDWMYSMYRPIRDRMEPLKDSYYYRLTSDFGKDRYSTDFGKDRYQSNFGKDGYLSHFDRIINNDYQSSNDILEIPFIRQTQVRPSPPTLSKPTVATVATPTPPNRITAMDIITPPSAAFVSPVSPLSPFFRPLEISPGFTSPNMPAIAPMTPEVKVPETYGQKLFRTALNILLTKTIVLSLLFFELTMVYIGQFLIIRPLKYLFNTMLGLAVEMFS